MDDLPGLPGLSDGLYLDITTFAHTTPHWLRTSVEVWTELGLVLFGVLFVAGWWRMRRADAAGMALALLAPLATAFGYVVSEGLKSLVDEERPCRAVAGAPEALVACPPHGDWSFPSNHSAIAGAAAVALVLSWRSGSRWLTASLALLMAVSMAFSRVFVGVHYPHDVVVGLLVGGGVAFVVMKAGARPTGALVGAARTSGQGAVVWCVGRGVRSRASARPEGVRHGAR
ncbi:phosphatase PAP2 family protein [Streptomyces sp. NPDC090025]|uniref:phosphatase PAP2 family protein n=1 Tax=Streptomyces sp. NPDC090025 TaxID=3365922 RepID=UPI0038354253